MALQRTTAYLPFAKGPDSKTDSKQVLPGKLLVLENGYFQSPGKISKRPGHTRIASGNILALSPFKSELLTFDGFQLSTLEKATGGFIAKGYLPTASVSSQPVAHGTASLGGVDCAYANGFQVVTWRESLTLHQWAVIETATGATLFTGTVGSGDTSQPKVLAFGAYFIMFFIDNSTGQLAYRTAFQSNPNVWSGGALSVGVGPTLFDAAIVSASQLVVAAALGSSAISIVTLDTGLNQANRGVNGENASFAINVAGNTGSQIWVVYSNGSAMKTVVYSSDLLTQIHAPTVAMSVANIVAITAYGGSPPFAYYTVKGTPYYQSRIGFTNLTGTGTVTDTTVLYSHILASKVAPVPNGSFFSLLVMFTSAVQPTYMTLYLDSANPNFSGVIYPCAKLAPGLAQVDFSDYETAPLPEMAVGPGTSLQVAYIQADQLFLDGSTTPAGYTFTLGVRVATLTFNVTPPSYAEIGNSLHPSLGVVYAYDGLNVTEQNFHYYPDQVSASAATTGGSIGAGSYQVCVTYEWVDGQGQPHRSAPSLPATVTTSGSTNTITASWLPLNFTAKGQLVQAVIYRTAANGTVFFRDGAVYNVLGTTLQTYVCTVSDSVLSAQNQLYTTGGEVENGAPPATLAVTTYKSRMIAVPAENPYQFWYSKQVIPGSPVEFSPLFTQNVDPQGGPITAVTAMDDKLIIIKQTSIMVVVGDGPAPSGQANDFTPGQLVATDVGTTVPASVVLTPLGVMFQSAKGISLLSRALETSYIGAPMEGEVKGNTVTSAVVVSAENQVRFSLSSGRTVVFDYLQGEWSVYTSPSAVQACMWGGAYTYATSAKVLQETPGVFTDDGVFYALKIQTSWLSFAGIQGFQRVRDALVLGDWKSAHTLQVQVAYDFDATVAQTTQIAASSSVVPYQFRVLLDRQKCETVSFTIQDSQTSPYGEGMDLSGLAFEVGVKGGANRVSQSKTNR